LFVGPPGIGKSALVDYAVGVASDFRVVRIVGVESEMTFGYAAVHQLALHLRSAGRSTTHSTRSASVSPS